MKARSLSTVRYLPLEAAERITKRLAPSFEPLAEIIPIRVELCELEEVDL